MSILLAKTIYEVRDSLRVRRSRGTVGFVPTMGALHAGHARLIQAARGRSDTVVVSIFVNPLQFDQPEDYQRYSRTLPSDLALCEQHGADIVFAPRVDEVYPPGAVTFVEVEGLTQHFCGAARPGHFRGVTTVVAKLFHMVGPDLAFFGEKDAQQLAIIARMTRDLDFPIEIVPVLTVREPDGLALSSRNARLNPEERRIAPVLYRALCLVRERIASGDHDAAAMLADARQLLERPAIRVDYFDLADPETMRPTRQIARPVRALGAIWAGATRLIDNLLCTPKNN